MCLAQGPQRSDAGGAGTCGLSFSSQALYHKATVLPSLPLANSEDPNEIPHDAVTHQSLHRLLKKNNQNSVKVIHIKFI